MASYYFIPSDTSLCQEGLPFQITLIFSIVCVCHQSQFVYSYFKQWCSRFFFLPNVHPNGIFSLQFQSQKFHNFNFILKLRQISLYWMLQLCTLLDNIRVTLQLIWILCTVCRPFLGYFMVDGCQHGFCALPRGKMQKKKKK